MISGVPLFFERALPSFLDTRHFQRDFIQIRSILRTLKDFSDIIFSLVFFFMGPRKRAFAPKM